MCTFSVRRQPALYTARLFVRISPVLRQSAPAPTSFLQQLKPHVGNLPCALPGISFVYPPCIRCLPHPCVRAAASFAAPPCAAPVPHQRFFQMNVSVLIRLPTAQHSEFFARISLTFAAQRRQPHLCAGHRTLYACRSNPPLSERFPFPVFANSSKIIRKHGKFKKNRKFQ